MARILTPLALVALLLANGCASSGPPTAQTAGVAPMLSVERFLQAANAGDLEAMARIFGTADGAIADDTGGALGCAFKRIGSWIRVSDRCASWQEIELRMNIIAMILQHDDYRIRSEASVPGRQRPATRVGVDLVRGGERFTDVPFVVVRSNDGRWMVEQIGLERITSGR
jgi:hypothetical protein